MDAKKAVKRRILIGLMDALCGILIALFCLIIVANTTIMVKGGDGDKPADFLGVTPVIVQSSSMSGDAEGHIEKGDLILVTEVSVDSIKEGDVILFMDEGTAVCHRVVGINIDDQGMKTFVTKGDSNSQVDAGEVTESQIIGGVSVRIPGIGALIGFLATPLGMILCIGVPLGIAIYKIYSRGKNKGTKDVETSEAID